MSLSVTKIKYLFQGQSAISHNWFKLHTDLIEENILTREADFFKRLYQRHILEKADEYWIKFPVTIGGAKESS